MCPSAYDLASKPGVLLATRHILTNFFFQERSPLNSVEADNTERFERWISTKASWLSAETIHGRAFLEISENRSASFWARSEFIQFPVKE